MDDFTKAYIKAALWASTDDDQNPLDDKYDESDLSPELLMAMMADCKSFQEKNAHLWETAESGRGEWNIDEQAGHDFWLTRNGHGVGFWDRPEIYGQENADFLTGACKAYGQMDLYEAQISNERPIIQGCHW